MKQKHTLCYFSSVLGTELRFDVGDFNYARNPVKYADVDCGIVSSAGYVGAL
jgi:hypothetical protein